MVEEHIGHLPLWPGRSPTHTTVFPCAGARPPWRRAGCWSSFRGTAGTAPAAVSQPPSSARLTRWARQHAAPVDGPRGAFCAPCMRLVVLTSGWPHPEWRAAPCMSPLMHPTSPCGFLLHPGCCCRRPRRLPPLQIIQRLLAAAVTDPWVGVRKAVLEALVSSDSLDPHLAQAEWWAGARAGAAGRRHGAAGACRWRARASLGLLALWHWACPLLCYCAAAASLAPPPAHTEATAPPPLSRSLLGAACAASSSR